MDKIPDIFAHLPIAQVAKHDKIEEHRQQKSGVKVADLWDSYNRLLR